MVLVQMFESPCRGCFIFSIYPFSRNHGSAENFGPRNERKLSHFPLNQRWFQMFLFSPRSLGSFDPIWLAHIFSIGLAENHQLDATVEPRIGGRQFHSPRSTCHPFRETSTSPKSTLEASGTWPSGVYIVSWRKLLDVIFFLGGIMSGLYWRKYCKSFWVWQTILRSNSHINLYLCLKWRGF